MEIKNYSIRTSFSVLFLTSIVFFQFYLFRNFILHNVVGFYAPNFDQASYLSMLYGIFDNIKLHGLKVLFESSSILPTGILFPINTTVFFLLGGASRFSALFPNFFYFILLEIFAFWSIKKISGKNYLGFIFIGLILSLNTPFLTGGLTDFRMDFLAFCLYGMFTTCVIRSKIFIDRKWSILTALLAVIMILMRTITLVYFFTTCIFLFSYFIYAYFFSKNKIAITTRIKNFILCLLIVFSLTLPFILLNKAALYDYYVLTHVEREKLIRGLPTGTNFIAWLCYYPKNIINIHIGAIGKISIGLLLGFYFLIYLIFPKKLIQRSESQYFTYFKMEFVFLFLAILSPLFILTLDPSKSDVVGGIVGIPLLWIVIWFSYYLDKKISPGIQLKFLHILPILILTLGLFNQWNSYQKLKLSISKRKELNNLSNMFLTIGNYIEAKHWETVPISYDQINDAINHGSLKIIFFEKNHKYLQANPEVLGNSIFAISLKDALECLNRSKVIILTINKYPDNSPYPHMQSIASFHPQLLKYAETHFNKLGDYFYEGLQYRVYVAS